jgi:hypothetical protein
MDKPRFRRWFGYNYLPLNLSAWLSIGFLIAMEIPLIDAWLRAQVETVWWWLLTVIAFGIFLAWWTLAHWHSD